MHTGYNLYAYAYALHMHMHTPQGYLWTDPAAVQHLSVRNVRPAADNGSLSLLVILKRDFALPW